MASFFKSAFEKLSTNNQERIVEATEYTALQVSPQGDLFGVFVEMRNYLKAISKGGVTKLKVNKKDAKALGTAVKGIGTGIKQIAEALDLMPSGKEAQAKMNAIVTGIDALKELGGAIFKFAGMLALSLPLLIIGIPALMLAGTMLLSVGGIFSLLNKIGVTKSIKEVATGLAIAGLAMVSLAGGIILTAIILMEGSKYISDAGEAGEYSMGLGGALGLVAAMIVGTGVVFGLVGIFASTIKKGAMAMLIASIPIVVLALSMSIFTEAVPPTADGWESIAQMGALVTGLGVLMAGAGAASAFIIPGAAAMILAGGALIAIAHGVSLMSKVLKPSLFKKGGLFADSSHETNGILGFGGGRTMSNMEWAMLSIARSVMLPPLVIAGMYAGAPALISTGNALISIAKGLEKFQALDIDYDKLPDQIAKVTTVLGDAFYAIGDKYPGGGPSIKSLVTGDYSGTSKVYQGIKAVSGMGRALAGIAMGVQSMADLKFPTKWDKDGNPIEFRTLTTEDFAKVSTNTQLIVTALSKTFSEVGSSEAAQGSTWFTSSDYEKGIKVVKKMGDPLAALADYVNAFTKEGITLKEIDNVSAKTEAIIKGLTSAFMQGKDGKIMKASEFQRMSFSYKRMATANADMAESFSEFKDNINDLDLEKVMEVRKMYEGLAALSKSDTNIVEDMSEAMIEAINMLAEKLSEFSEGVQSTAVSAQPVAIPQAVSQSTGSNNNQAGSNNSELIAAIQSLQMVMSGTLPVYVTNQEGL